MPSGPVARVTRYAPLTALAAAGIMAVATACESSAAQPGSSRSTSYPHATAGQLARAVPSCTHIRSVEATYDTERAFRTIAQCTIGSLQIRFAAVPRQTASFVAVRPTAGIWLVSGSTWEVMVVGERSAADDVAAALGGSVTGE